MNIEKARLAVDEIDRDIQSLMSLKNLIQEALAEINSSSTSTYSFSQEIALKGYMLIYDSYVRPISPYIESIHGNSSPESINNGSDSEALTLGLKGEWQSFELSTLLGALSYIHNINTLNKKLDSNNVDYRIKKGQTRYPVFQNAKVHYYLEKSEELKIKQLHISSPGMVDFIANNFSNGAFLAALLVAIHKAPDFVNKIMTAWFKYKKDNFAVRKLERDDRTEELVSIFIDRELRKHLERESCDSEEILKVLEEVKNISVKNKLAKPDVLIEKALHSMASLSNLDKNGKYHVVKKKSR